LEATLATHFLDLENVSILDKLRVAFESNCTPLETIEKLQSGQSAGEKGDSFVKQHLESINRIFDRGCVEDILIELQKESEKTQEKWVLQALKALQTSSPLSLKIIFEELRRGKGMDLADAYQMEFALATHFMEQSDFDEGVRALLIDKDNLPNWNPKTLDAITDSMVNSYFVPVERKLSL